MTLLLCAVLLLVLLAGEDVANTVKLLAEVAVLHLLFAGLLLGSTAGRGDRVTNRLDGVGYGVDAIVLNTVSWKPRTSEGLHIR